MTRRLLALCWSFALITSACSGKSAQKGSGDQADGAVPRDASDEWIDAQPGKEPDGGILLDCSDLTCSLGSVCEVVNAAPVCVGEVCSDLACSDTQVCKPAPSGTGFFCADNRCADDLECADTEHCNEQGVCSADGCMPDAQRCDGQNVQTCASNGSGFVTALTCGGAGSFASRCTVTGESAYCPCEADWDCPSYTACVVGRCEGTGRAPTCTLDPAPFSEAMPSAEYGTRGGHWGGKSKADVNAQPGTPFPASTQVVMTPAVANLTDDNGDGLINESDFPEIVFLSFCEAVAPGSINYSVQGILRAIHGGGDKKGEDLFAACGKALTWQAGEATEGAGAAACPCSTATVSTPADLDPTAGVAVGDLDNDGSPEIVALTQDTRLRIFDRRGRFIAQSDRVSDDDRDNGSPTLANVDGSGLSEIVIGSVVAVLTQVADGQGGMKLSFQTLFNGERATGDNGQGPISCVADVHSTPGLELVAGASVYHLPRAPQAGELSISVTSPLDCTSADVPDLADDAREAELKAYCDQKLVLIWDAQTANAMSVADREGFCAVADVWGADQGSLGMLAPRPGPSNPLDGKPEVVLITDGQLQIYNGQTGRLIYNENVELGGNFGGAPNVDDFDGDGFPEIGTAFATFYAMVDLQPSTSVCPAWPATWPTYNLDGSPTGPDPAANAARSVPPMACTSDADCAAIDPALACNEASGRCVCFHNGWRRRTRDASSKVTGSSLFDFNGDGTTEVVYNDECFFRVYNGVDGEELFRDPSESRTRTENPVIADVDNDGNAEIVFSTSTESEHCQNETGTTWRKEASYRPGIEVWGDAADRWVSARRIYNQHAYHVTNVLEGGGIPRVEPPSWLPLNGRIYNSYRSQPRSGVGIAAPNLVVGKVQLSSPNTVCGELSPTDLTLSVRVENRGDLRVGPGVSVGLYGSWANPVLDEALKDAMGSPLRLQLTKPLEPGSELVLSTAYKVSQNGRTDLPERVRVVLDEGNTQRECKEDDNELSVNVADATEAVADLVVEVKASGNCVEESFEVTVRNEGAVQAAGVRYAIYFGEPSSGAQPVTGFTIPEPIAPGASTTHTTVIPAFPARNVQVYVVVDPMDVVRECNDANNTAVVEVLCAPGDPF